MAGDWIKMRTDLYRDPKVCVMADHLMYEDGELASYVSQNKQRDMTVTRNVMRNVTVGALVSVWGVLRHRGKRDGNDLVLSRVTLAVIDDVADLPGFGSAMALVGWAVESKAGVVFPRFFEDYNVEPTSEGKSKNALRQKRFRDKSNGVSNVTDNVTGALQSNDRVEKSREENKDTLAGTKSGEKLSPAKRGKTPKPPPKPRKPNLLFDAIAEATGLSPATAGSHIGSVSAALASEDPPFTPDEVRAFARDFWKHCPYAAEKKRERPTPNEIQKNIGLVRAGSPSSRDSPSRSPGPRQFPGVLDDDVAVVVTVRARYKSKDYDRERAELELRKINPNYTGAILDVA